MARIKGLFARIERWTDVETREIHWRSISRDNVTTLYGKDNNSRILDPEDKDPSHPTRIFTWLICESYRRQRKRHRPRVRGRERRQYGSTQANERNRVRTANRYLKRIKYGNHVSRLLRPQLDPDEVDVRGGL